MLFIILIGITSFFVAVLAVQNSMAVQLSFFTWPFDSNLIIVVIISVLAGLVIAACWGLKLKTQSAWRTHKLNDQIQKLTKENKALQGEIAALKQQLPDAVPELEDKKEIVQP